MAHASGKRPRKCVVKNSSLQSGEQFFSYGFDFSFHAETIFVAVINCDGSALWFRKHRKRKSERKPDKTADWTDRETIFMWHFFIYFRRWHLSFRDIPEDVLNTYCWIHSTYTVVDAFMKKQGQEVPFPGVDNSQSRGQLTIKHTKYYQWVAFTLFFQVSINDLFPNSLQAAGQRIPFFAPRTAN